MHGFWIIILVMKWGKLRININTCWDAAFNKYTRAVDELKSKAVHGMPEIEL